MEIDHLGWGIWSQIRRMTGANLNGSRPAQISTSACRGEKLWRSIPNRAMSNRLAAVAMYSMAQQAVPNGMGQSELLRAQLVRKSSRVVTQLGEIDETVVPSSPWYSVAGLVNPIATLHASICKRTPPPE
jgi:hypothetical protein